MTSSAAPVVDVDNLEVAFGHGARQVRAIAEVSLQVAAGEFVSIVGPSGCGKTTLLRVLAGLLSPSTGTAKIGAEGPTSMVFQDAALFPWMTVVENIEVGAKRLAHSRDERKELARSFGKLVGLGRVADRYPHELSGGMRQRVNLARALVARPGLLLMDEPFRSLDAQTRLILQEELMDRWAATGSAVVFVTHDIEEAILLGDRVLVMAGAPGRIVEAFETDWSRPRDLTGRAHPGLAELKWEIWKLLRSDAEQRLLHA